MGVIRIFGVILGVLGAFLWFLGLRLYADFPFFTSLSDFFNIMSAMGLNLFTPILFLLFALFSYKKYYFGGVVTATLCICIGLFYLFLGTLIFHDKKFILLVDIPILVTSCACLFYTVFYVKQN